MLELLPKISLISFAICVLYLIASLATSSSLSSQLPIATAMVGSLLIGLLGQISFGTGIACLVLLFTASGRAARPTIKLQLIIAGAIQILSIVAIVFAYIWFLATSDFSH